jgi:exodeoxyribonuclease-3
MAQLLKIATWNINSVRIRQIQLKSWLQRNNIDILLLQEIKCQSEQFPEEELSDLGYNCYIHGQKSYNGVAILSKFPADEIITNFPLNPCPEEARFIEIKGQFPIGYSRIISVYVPNGGEAFSDKFQLKLKFLDSLKLYLNEREFDEKFIIGGDFNVAPEEVDVYSCDEMKDVTCFTDVERARIRSILNNGLVDPARVIDQKHSEFTWWDYRAGCFQHDKGLRIDYFLTSPNCIAFLNKCISDKSERAKEKASDHAPVIMELQF